MKKEWALCGNDGRYFCKCYDPTMARTTEHWDFAEKFPTRAAADEFARRECLTGFDPVTEP